MFWLSYRHNKYLICYIEKDFTSLYFHIKKSVNAVEKSIINTYLITWYSIHRGNEQFSTLKLYFKTIVFSLWEEFPLCSDPEGGEGEKEMGREHHFQVTT